jgi:endonuclease YncB( thermonuclease family)
MPFTLIKGTYRPLAGIPDGDSLRFRANNLSLWKKLEGASVVLGTGAETKDTVQLRLEGIDAIEKGAAKNVDPKKSLSTQARDNLFARINFDKDTNPQPAGYILSRMTDDKSRRPICFIFYGKTNLADGSSVMLDAKLLRKSVNYQQMLDGYAYPLYYNTLFASLRNEFTSALQLAKKAKRGYWPTDKTSQGATVISAGSLASIPPIWPKLWRRLETHFRNNTSLKGFIDFLTKENERVDILPIMEERGLQDIVKVTGNKVRLTVLPENVRVVANAGKRRR